MFSDEDDSTQSEGNEIGTECEIMKPNISNTVTSTNNVIFKTNTKTETSQQFNKQIKTEEKGNWYKCSECTKCFKDPDVFTLHKRSHNKQIGDLKLNSTEMLQSNPILANLLKRPTEPLDSENNFNLGNHVTTALAANLMLFKNVTSGLTNVNQEDNQNLNDSDESDHLVINESM